MKHLFQNLREKNLNVAGLKEIKAKHIEVYIQAEIEKGISPRTLQNRMANIRTALIALGRNQLANHPRLSCENLGISGVSRNGTHTALTNEHYEKIVAQAKTLDKPEFLAVIELQRVFGLRASEAIQCGKSLQTWEKQLKLGYGRITILHGTKGGRVRDTSPTSLKRGLEAIRGALEALEPKTGRLIRSETLEGARRSFLRDCAKIELTGEFASHSLRYSYAQERKMQALQAGFDEKEARALVSLELGHGDGRGTYIEQVYAQR